MPERADPDRDAGERREGQQPRNAMEDGGQHGREHEDDGDAAHDPRRLVRVERGREQARAERGEAEAGGALPPRGGDEQQREAETRDGAADAREADHRTTTDRVSEWPPSVTVNR